jgi:Glycosyl hydrolase catalytic core
MSRRAAFAVMALALACWPGRGLAAELRSSELGNVFTVGQIPSFTLHADAGNAHWRARDFFGNEVASGDLSLTDGAVVFHPQIRGLGYFKLDISLERSPQIQTAMAILPPPNPPSKNSPFGVVTHFAKDWPTDIIPLIGKAGIARVRDEQPWRKVEKQPGQYQFPPRLNTYMTELAGQKIDPLIVLAFSNPLYDNDKTPFDDDGRAAYAAYAGAVAQRYRGQVSAVEVWNEYSGSFCDGPCRTDRPAYYAAMLKQTYKNLKAANPSLIVAGGAAVPIPLDYFDSLFRHGALDAMDAIVIHPYRKVPEGVEEKIEGLRQMMTRYGKPKPIWATEFGDTADMHKNRDDVARYLVRMSTLLLAAGTERIYWYLLKDYQEFSGMGLLLSESDPAGRYVATPTYAAYATLIKQLDGARFVRREASDPQARVYLFSKGGTDIRIAWSTTGTEKFEMRSGTALQQLDLMGNAKTLLPQHGALSIALDENPVYLTSAPSGGPPANATATGRP